MKYTLTRTTQGWKQYGVAMALYSNGMNAKKALADILSNGGTIEDSDALAKDAELNERNMILELTAYLVRRLSNPIGFCMICDKSIVNQSIKDPTICTIGTCQFNFIELGVCASIGVSICPSSIAGRYFQIKKSGGTLLIIPHFRRYHEQS